MNQEELFELARQGDKAAKEKIVSDNNGLVWSVARRFVGRGYDLDEIYQIGCIGLLKAIDRFSFSYEVQFSTYAVPLIAGEIKRFLRDNGMIKVSRILKQNGYRVSQAKLALSNQYGREATLLEISDYTGLKVEDIMLATEANREIESIYQTVSGQDGKEMYLVDKLSDAEAECSEVDRLMNSLIIEKAMDELGEMERELITMRYFQDKTQNQIAEKLGISQVQVSRLEKKILRNMRNSIDRKSN